MEIEFSIVMVLLATVLVLLQQLLLLLLLLLLIALEDVLVVVVVVVVVVEVLVSLVCLAGNGLKASGSDMWFCSYLVMHGSCFGDVDGDGVLSYLLNFDG